MTEKAGNVTQDGTEPKGAVRVPHVCFFPGQLQLGGVGRTTLNLVEELLARGVRVDLFLSKKAGVYLSQVPESARIFEGGGSVRRSVLPLARYLRREAPDLLIAARPYINIAALLAKRLARVHTKVAITEHTSHGTERELLGGIRKPLIRMGCRILYPTADHIVAVSGAVADDLAQNLRIQAESIQVIHNPVVTARIEGLYREAVEDPWLEASSTPIILGVGRLTFQKDFFTLIRAFAEVRREIEARLVILGEGEDRAGLEALARELDVESDVHLPGYVDNPFAYMARAQVFALSSRWEGLPTVLIEALAAGVPVISTDCPGGSAEILVDGEFGALVPVGSVDELAREIRSALVQPPGPDILRERAAHFSATRAADAYLGLMAE